MDNNQLPIGLGLSLAMNQKAMDRFSGMTEAEKERTIAKSRGVKSKREETLSATDLMERLGLSHKPTFRKNYLNPALEQKLIERTIPNKPNSKNQKYRKHQNLEKEC